MISIDSNAPYATEFPASTAGNAVYMRADDPVLGKVLAIVYRASPKSQRLSVILIGAHGTSGYVDMTLTESSRFFGACKGLAQSHYKSPVRRALAMAALRTFATMDKPLRASLMSRAQEKLGQLKAYDESTAGALGSQFHLLYGKYPQEIGTRMLQSGAITAKNIKTSIVDIIYEDSDLTIEQNNQLVYLLGNQLEHLFDPLNEYSPEPTEKLYAPPEQPNTSLDDDPQLVQDICEELYLLESRIRGDLIDFLQMFLIPLRVLVLKGSLEGVTIEKLNRVFPPTIDELFRVNSLLYDALRAALPLGAFEVMRACGTTIPYFYRACMRHEAATRSFPTDMASLGPQVQALAEEYSIPRIESVIQNSLHLVKLKLILDRLASSKQWQPDQKAAIEEFHSVAVGTIDSFGREKSSEKYNGRVFTKSGKLLVEIASGWPAELEYGWITRRVVSIFDAVDVLEVDDRYRQLHDVVILFTDAVVICKPSEPIPTTSLSGLHVPAIGDMLMHAMLNEVPLDQNIPPLKVTAWAPILDITFSSFGLKELYISTQPGPFKPDGGFNKVYNLVQPDHFADRFVELLAKAKMTTKTQQFHLFKLESTDLTLYSTVQELNGYKDEVNRNNVAIFLSRKLTAASLDQHELTAAISLAFSPTDNDVVDVQIMSRLKYNATTSVRREALHDFVLSEVSYLVTLAHSSQNAAAIPAIIGSNTDIATKILDWASAPSTNSRGHGHRRKSIPVVGRASGPMVFAVPRDSKESLLAIKPKMVGTTSHSDMFNKPVQPLHIKSKSKESLATPQSIRLNLAKQASASNPELSLPVPRLRRKDSFSKPRAASDSISSERLNELTKEPSVESELFYSSHSLSSFAVQSLDNIPASKSKGSDHSLWENEDEAEQKDVDTWYSQLNQRDADSLSSEMSDVSFSQSGSQSMSVSGSGSGSAIRSRDGSREDDDLSRNGSSASESIQIGAFLSRQASQLYNKSAGRAFAPLSNSSTEASMASLESDKGTTDDQDFSYLAELVRSGSDASSLVSGYNNPKIYPDLRDTSVARLGQFILRNDKSDWNLRSNRDITNIGALDPPKIDLADSDETTPTLESVRAGNTKWSHPDLAASATRAVDIPEEEAESQEPEDPEENWLAWVDAQKSLRASRNSLASHISRLSIMSKASRMSEDSIQFTPQPDLQESKSMSNFKKMVMASSLNTLQMASFSVQLDQKARSAPVALSREFERMKQVITAMFNEKNPDPKLEPLKRRQLMAMTWILISLGLQPMAEGLLELEWIRRTRIVDTETPQITQGLWTT